jgi:hypothetical protein
MCGTKLIFDPANFFNLVPVPHIFNSDLEKTNWKFIDITYKIILQYSFFKFVSSTTSTFRLIFVELRSNLYDLPANGTKTMQHVTIYLTFEPKFSVSTVF